MCPRTQLHVRRTKDIWCIRPHNEAGHIPWVISFLATCSPLISGKHLPGITSDACSGPGPHHRYVACGPQLRWFRAIVPFVVGRDYAMWATITVKQKMRPTSQRNPGPRHTGISGSHPMESPAYIDRNTHQLRKRSERILSYVPNGRCASQDGQSPGWWSARGLAI